MKLDRLFTSHIEQDPARRAMAEALIVFARRTGIGSRSHPIFIRSIGRWMRTPIRMHSTEATATAL